MNLSIILFSIIIINYIPLLIPNAMSKESFGVSNKNMLICFFIELFILGIYFLFQFKKNKKDIKLTKDMKINFILLVVSSFIMFVTQLINFMNKDFKFMDILNIGCMFINIFLLYICIMNIKIEEKNIYLFFKLIVAFATLACIVSIFIYYKEIYNLVAFGKYRWDSTVKSFFSNRNTYAFILYIAVIADSFVVLKDKNIIYKLVLFLFLFSLYTTMSRTGIVLGVILIGMIFLFSNKINWKIKVSLILLFLIGIASLFLFLHNNKTVWNRINGTLLRLDEIKTISGRTEIWERGIELLKESPKNLILGVGRFKSMDSLVNVGEKRPKTFTQFHNTYLEMLTTGGIIELAYILSIYLYVIVKILRSNLEKKYKNLYMAMFVTYAIYVAIESFGRFSIGASDTICLIFFITIPLLHANSIKENKE